MRQIRTAVTVLATTFLAWPFLQAHADPATGEAAAAVSLAAGGPGAPAEAKMVGVTRTAKNPFGMTAVAVANDKLDGVRGGAEVVVSDMRLHGTVADNSVNGALTGSNIVSEGAFASAAGIPTAIQNSGNAVLIQNATIVNIQFKQ